MSKVKVAKRSITINNRRVSFDADITDVVELPTRTLVAVDSYDFHEDDTLRGRNVFALDDHGELLWRIEDGGSTVEGSRGQDIPIGFTGIDKTKDGRVQAYTWFGFRFDVDPETGKLSNPVRVDK